MEKHKEMPVGNISGYYGGLVIEERSGKYFWGIVDHGGINEEEIPESLFQELLKFKNSTNTSWDDKYSK